MCVHVIMAKFANLQNSSKSTTDTQLRQVWFAVQCVQESTRPEQLPLTGHSTFRCISAFSGLSLTVAARP